jgi:hypothetical protein
VASCNAIAILSLSLQGTESQRIKMNSANNDVAIPVVIVTIGIFLVLFLCYFIRYLRDRDSKVMYYDDIRLPLMGGLQRRLSEMKAVMNLRYFDLGRNAIDARCLIKLKKNDVAEPRRMRPKKAKGASGEPYAMV